MALKRSPPPCVAATPATVDCAASLKALADTDPARRRLAARDVIQCPQAGDALAARLVQETEPSVREALLLSLSQLADPVSIDALLNCLRSEDVPLRNEACATLQQMGASTAVVQAARELLLDDDADVRQYAVDILGPASHPDIGSWLIEVMDDDPEINVAALAATWLAEHPLADAGAALQRLARRFPESDYLQFVVARALSRVEGS